MQPITIKHVALNATQQKLWSDTRVALMWQCPAFTHIFYTMMSDPRNPQLALFTDAVPIAATDGKTMLLNPEAFFKLNLYERVFVCAHEIMHCVFNHCGLGHQLSRIGKVAYPDGVSLAYDQQLMNVAMDLVINDALVQSGVGQMPKQAVHDPKLATAANSFLDAYRTIYKQKPQGGGGGGGFDDHLAPGSASGKSAHEAINERSEAEWAATVAQAVQVAKARDKMPAALERLLAEVLEPQINWREHIQSLFARKLGSGSYDWRRPDRRLIVQDIYAPGRSGFGAENVVVAVDTSGSVGDKELEMFLAEIGGILEDVRPKRTFIVWCDAKVQRVDELHDANELSSIKKKGAPGGGGTDFRPVFDWIAEQGMTPDALAYLTDGMGAFPQHAPAYPVIWGSIYKPSQYPFGDVVDVPKQA